MVLIYFYLIGKMKTRLIMGHGGHAHGGGDYGNSATDIIRNTWRNEGIHGFFRGYVPALLKGVPSHMISFLVYEYFRRYWGVEKSHKKKH